MFATSITAARRKAVPASLIAIAIGTVTVSAAGTAGATSVPPSSEPAVVIVDAGDVSQPVDLRAQPAVGSAATNTSVSTVTGTLAIEGTETQSVDLDVTTTVVQFGEVTAADDTGMTMRRRVESYDVTDNSSTSGAGESFASDEELGELVGLEFDYLFDADNRLQDVVPAPGVELTADQEAAVEEVIADGMDNAGLPTEPVGVGAEWTAELPGASGPAGALMATYTLTSFDDGQFTIDVTVEGDGDMYDADELPSGFDEVTGTVTATGQLVGSVDEPLIRTTDMTLDMDLVFTGAAGEMTMDITMNEQESAAAA